MPSPFKIFRKREKLMIAVLGLLAMIAFVVLPIIMQNMGSRQRSNPRVVTTTQYGDIHEFQLHRIRQNRQILLGFLRQLQQAVMVAGGETQSVEMAIQEIGTASEEHVVDSWLLTRRAEELGLVVDDVAINTYLKALTTARKDTRERGQQFQKIRITEKQVQQILDTLGISGDDLLDLLHPELMAVQLRKMFHVSLYGAPPAQRWDYYQRLNRKVAIEAVPIPVAKYVTEVTSPDDAVLRGFFDEHKENLADPASPEPGFREPHKIAIEYFKAEYEKFIDLDAVTEAEIKAEYEKVKDDYYQQEELPGLDDEQPSTTDPGDEAAGQESAAPEASTDDPGTGAAVQPAAEGTPSTQDAAGQNPPQEPPAETPAPEESGDAPGPPQQDGTGPEDQPATTPAEDPAPDDQQEPVPPEASPAPPAEQTPPDSASSDETSSVSEPSPFRLAAFQQEGEPADAPPTETPPAETPPTESTPAEVPVAETTPAETPATETTPAEAPVAETPPAETPPTESTPAEAPVAETTPAETPPTETTPAEEPAGESMEEIVDSIVGEEGSGEATAGQTKYKPLEDVEDEIRRRLARGKAREKIEDVLGRLRNRMAEYHDELIHYRVIMADKKQGEGPSPPAKLDFRALAKENGLSAYKTELISALDAMESDIGRSFVSGQIPFVRYAYDRLPEEYRPETSQDIDGNHYLFWSIEDSEERVPEFEEEGVRDRVLRAWKRDRARGLAKQEAERLVAELAKQEAETGKAAKSLKDAFAGKRGIVVNETDPFSWLTYGDIPAIWAQTPPRISPIKIKTLENEAGEQQEREAVVMPGDEFMRMVFSLKQGQIGLAMNQPKTAVYVVRVKEINPLPEVLLRRFLAEDYIGYFRVAYYDQIESERAWLDEIKSEVGFKWERPAQQVLARR